MTLESMSFQTSMWQNRKKKLSTFAAKWNMVYVLSGSTWTTVWVVGYTSFFQKTHFYFKQWLTWHTIFILKDWWTHTNYSDLGIRMIFSWNHQQSVIVTRTKTDSNCGPWLYRTFQVKVRIFEYLYPSPWAWEILDS